MNQISLSILPALLLITACRHPAGPDINASAPLAPLTDLQGLSVSLQTLAKEKEATLLVFFSTTCPCVRRYQDRVEALPRQYPAAQVFYVSSNADDDLDALKRAQTERGLTVPILVDWSGSLSQQLGARSTPTVVLLDRSGQVRFRGWIDNERLPGEPGRSAYLEKAMEGLLSHQTAFQTTSPAYGCTITRSLLGGRTAPQPNADQHCH